MQCELSSTRAPGEIKQQDRDDYVESFEGFLRPSESLICFRKCHMKNAFTVQMPALCMGLPVGWVAEDWGSVFPHLYGRLARRNFHLMCLHKVLKGNDD